MKADMAHIDATLADMGGSSAKRIEEAKKAFNLVIGISKTFKNGTFEEKQEALSALGSNITLKDKKLNVINAEIFSVIQKGLLEAKSKNRAFEPKKYQANKGETEVFASVIPALLPRLHIYRTV